MSGITRVSMMVVVLGVGSLAGQVRSAEACSCIQPGFELLSPSAVEPAPLNAVVRVAYSQSWSPPITIELRQGGKPVRVVSRVIGSGRWRVVELDPIGPLLPHHSYEVMAREGGVSPSETVVGSFTVGSKVDAESPSWSGVRRAIVVKHRAEAARCSQSDRYAVLFAEPAVDATPSQTMLYAVWVQNGKGTVDTSQPPVTFVRHVNGRLSLGSPDACDRAGLQLPRRGALLVAVAAVDQAGNRSHPRRVKLMLSRAFPPAP